MLNWSDKVDFIWSVKEILRDHYKRHEYGQVILPLAVLRRLDCVLEPTRASVRARAEQLSGSADDHYDLLCHAAGQQFYNTSQFNFAALLDDPEHVADNLRYWLNAFSPNARDIIDKFDFFRHIERLDRSGILYATVQRFTRIDLHPSAVSNLEMGYIYEELIRGVADLSNEEAGEHFTPREVIRLMVNLLLVDDRDLNLAGKVFTVYDPTAGTGGMLTETERRLRDINPTARVHLYGQEVAPESYAICRSDLMITGHDAGNVAFGSTLTADGFPDRNFTYILANPPYGKDWKTEKSAIEKERADTGAAGRFGPGLPSTTDGQLLFLLHMISKMRRPAQGGSRIAVVTNGSPLFAGGAGSGPSNIRCSLLESDIVEAIVALPDQMFYNTGINTYVWILANRKVSERQGVVQLLDGRQMFAKMGKSLGNKRNYLTDKNLMDLTAAYEALTESDISQVVQCEDFGFRTVVVERPLRVRFELSESAIEAVWVGAVAKLSKSDRGKLAEHLSSRVGAAAADEDAFLSKLNLPFGAPVRGVVAKVCRVRDPSAPALHDRKGRPIPDPHLRDSEDVPLNVSVDEYMMREVLPFVPDAWVSDADGVIGYEIPFTRRFYRYQPPRPVAEIDADIKASQRRIIDLIGSVTV